MKKTVLKTIEIIFPDGRKVETKVQGTGREILFHLIAVAKQNKKTK